MYRVDKYVRVVICLRREYNKIIILLLPLEEKDTFLDVDVFCSLLGQWGEVFQSIFRLNAR